MYLSAQLVQIASSIITRYENVDPCTRAQTHCYECNLEASWGRPYSKLRWEKGKCGEWVSGGNKNVTRRRKELLCISPFFYDSSLHFIFKRNSLFLISVSNEQYHSLVGGLLLFTSSMYWLSSLYITHFMCGS